MRLTFFSLCSMFVAACSTDPPPYDPVFVPAATGDASASPTPSSVATRPATTTVASTPQSTTAAVAPTAPATPPPSTSSSDAGMSEAGSDAGSVASDGGADAGLGSHYINGVWFPCANWATADYPSLSVHVNYKSDPSGQGPHDAYASCSSSAFTSCANYIRTYGTQPNPLDTYYLFPASGDCRLSIPTACQGCGSGTEW